MGKVAFIVVVVVVGCFDAAIGGFFGVVGLIYFLMFYKPIVTLPIDQSQNKDVRDKVREN